MTPQDAAKAIARLEGLAVRHDTQAAGRRVAWRRFGAGAPLVLLHGGHGSWLHWVRNIEAWSAQHALWVPDMPGYGDSGDAAGARLDDIVDALDAGLDQLLGAQAPVALAGFSFGGLVAATWAARRASTRHLVLLGPAGHGGTRRPRGAMRAWQDLAPHSPAWQDAMRHNLLMHMLHDEAGLDDLAMEVHGRACLATRFKSKSISRATGLAAALEAFHGPVLKLWGAHDVTGVPGPLIAALAHPHPRSEAQVVDGAGHWVQFERAEAVNRLVADWLARCNP